MVEWAAGVECWRRPGDATWADNAARFVQQDSSKIVAVYCLVLLLLVLGAGPPVLLLLLGAALLLLRRYMAGGWYHSETRLDGRTVLLTGASGGIGRQTARDLYRRGARLILACRDVRKARSVAHEIAIGLPSTGGSLVVKQLDLASLKSVRELAADVNATEKRLDVLINNAGVARVPFEKTEDGFELTFQVNHLAPFLLTTLMLAKLREAPQGRVINVSSMAHHYANGINFSDLNKEQAFDNEVQYNTTKLMNVVFASELSRRLADSRVTSHSVHPGRVHTDLLHHVASGGALRLVRWLVQWSTFKTAEQGAQTVILLAADPAFAAVSGRYYADCEEAVPHSLAYSPVLGRRLWEDSERLSSPAATENSNGNTTTQ